MSCCNSIDVFFSAKHADGDVKRYLTKGPDPSTRLLIKALRSAKLDHPSLTDIGAGIGVLQHELLPNDVASVTHIDASPAYLNAARSECAKRNNQDRVSFIEGDVADVAPDLDSTDAVLLDRVICCYPNVDELIKHATSLSRSFFAVAYPRDNLLIRIGFKLDNLKRRIRGDSFRAFVHPARYVESKISDAGFERVSVENSLVWRVVAFKRAS